jgi:hypothetical protein
VLACLLCCFHAGELVGSSTGANKITCDCHITSSSLFTALPAACFSFPCRGAGWQQHGRQQDQAGDQPAQPARCVQLLLTPPYSPTAVLACRLLHSMQGSWLAAARAPTRSGLKPTCAATCHRTACQSRSTSLSQQQRRRLLQPQPPYRLGHTVTAGAAATAQGGLFGVEPAAEAAPATAAATV